VGIAVAGMPVLTIYLTCILSSCAWEFGGFALQSRHEVVVCHNGVQRKLRQCQMIPASLRRQSMRACNRHVVSS
jgi:hypothetical protein